MTLIEHLVIKFIFIADYSIVIKLPNAGAHLHITEIQCQIISKSFQFFISCSMGINVLYIPGQAKLNSFCICFQGSSQYIRGPTAEGL